MVEERAEVVYEYDNPCRYLQQVFRSFLRCLGLENQGEEGNISGGVGGDGGGEVGGDGGGGGAAREEVDDLPTTSPVMDPTDESVSTTGMVRRRPPPRGRGPISSGGPGQTN